MVEGVPVLNVCGFFRDRLLAVFPKKPPGLNFRWEHLVRFLQHSKPVVPTVWAHDPAFHEITTLQMNFHGACDPTCNYHDPIWACDP